MMLLADTSVWIDHLRRPSGNLIAALEGDIVLMHPFVVGELGVGNLRNRGEGHPPLLGAVAVRRRARRTSR